MIWTTWLHMVSEEKHSVWTSIMKYVSIKHMPTEVKLLVPC